MADPFRMAITAEMIGAEAMEHLRASLRNAPPGKIAIDYEGENIFLTGENPARVVIFLRDNTDLDPKIFFRLLEANAQLAKAHGVGKSNEEYSRAPDEAPMEPPGMEGVSKVKLIIGLILVGLAGIGYYILNAR